MRETMTHYCVNVFYLTGQQAQGRNFYLYGSESGSPTRYLSVTLELRSVKPFRATNGEMVGGLCYKAAASKIGQRRFAAPQSNLGYSEPTPA